MQAAWIQWVEYPDIQWVGHGKQQGDRVWWEESERTQISKAGSCSEAITPESDKSTVAQLLYLSFLICKTKMTAATSQSCC